VTAQVTLPASFWAYPTKTPFLPAGPIALPSTEIISSVPMQKIRLVHETDRTHLDKDFIALLESANAGLEEWTPELVGEGEGGTYFMRNLKGDIVGVFKPEDEDPQSPSNPKKNKKVRDEDGDDRDEDRDDDSDESQEKLRTTIPLGTTALREVAAYRLDRGLAGVPVTVLVEVDDWRENGKKKIGSFQKFVPKGAASWDLGPSKYSIADTHKIGILDLRMHNTDRHGGNMLAVALPQKGIEGNTHGLVPIDHGYCFPTSMSEGSFEWFYWPQAKKPFSSEMLEYIQKIDVEEDQRLLKSVGIVEEEALRVNKIATLALKAGAKAGLNLYQIACICSRKVPDALSPLELACGQVEEQMKQKGISSFEEEYWSLLNAKLSELLKPMH